MVGDNSVCSGPVDGGGEWTGDNSDSTDDNCVVGDATVDDDDDDDVGLVIVVTVASGDDAIVVVAVAAAAAAAVNDGCCVAVAGKYALISVAVTGSMSTSETLMANDRNIKSAMVESIFLHNFNNRL